MPRTIVCDVNETLLTSAHWSRTSAYVINRQEMEKVSREHTSSRRPPACSRACRTSPTTPTSSLGIRRASDLACRDWYRPVSRLPLAGETYWGGQN
jgi:hypothetical protein